MVDKRETAEKESEKGKTHYESQNVCSFKHLHAILSHHVSVWPTLVMFRVVDIIIVKVLAHESNRAHETYTHVSKAYQYIPKENISFIVFLLCIVSNNWQANSVQEVPNT